MVARRYLEAPVKGMTVSGETVKPPLTGRARSLANLKPFVKGVSPNPGGRPKDLARFGDILMREFYKTVVATMNGKTGGGKSCPDVQPLTSAVRAPACLTGSNLPFHGGSSATAGAGLSPTPVPAPCVAGASNVSPVSTRTAWLPARPQSAARSHSA